MKAISIFTLILAYAFLPHAASAAPPNLAAGEGCGILSSSVLQKTLGVEFAPEPLATKAPPAYDGAWGSSCQYSTRPNSAHRMTVDMLIYAESSPSVAKDTFDKAAVFFADAGKPKPSVGDAAYWQTGDKGDAIIHVLKGNVHFSIQLKPGDDAQTQALANTVAAQL